MNPKDFQTTLKTAGFDPGPIDGIWGNKTAGAAERWFDTSRNIVVVEAIAPPSPDDQVTSPEGIDFIIGWEGERLTAYKDSAGIWTIGVGHTSSAGPPKVTPGMTITRQESREIFAHDLIAFEHRVRDEFGPIPQEVFDGAVSFDFNTGGINRASWPDLWKAENYPKSEKKLKEWNKAGGEVNRGLVKRRAAEADMIFRNDYSGRP